MKAPKVGDQVQYKAAFLRNIGTYTGDICFTKGEVTEIKDLGSIKLAVIDWDKPDIPKTVNVNNLKLVSDWEPN